MVDAQPEREAESSILHRVRHYHCQLEREEWKLDVLCDLHEFLTGTQAVVYCSTRSKIDWLAEAMNGRDLTVSATSADIDPGEPTDTSSPCHSESEELIAVSNSEIDCLRDFAQGKARVFIASRHVYWGQPQIEVIVNYDMPQTPESYLRRLGRCKSDVQLRRSTMVLNFITETDMSALQDIEAGLETKIPEMPSNLADLF